MLKKLLMVGAMVAGVFLSSNAMASNECAKIYNKKIHIYGNLYKMYVVNPTNHFANYFERDGIKWYIKSKGEECIFHTGLPAYQAYYEGRG